MEHATFDTEHSAFDPAVVASSAAIVRTTRSSAQRAALAAVPRHNLYRKIHLGLRVCMSDALAAIGRIDTDDPADVAAITQQMSELIMLFRGHLEVEDAFIHPAIEARRPGATARIAHDHAEHVAAFAALVADVQALRDAPRSQRDAAARALYRDLAAFVADNLVHMAAEESDHNAVLWATYSDDELLAIEKAIIASIAPAKMFVYLRWIVPAIPPAERLAMMSAMRESAPAEAFDATLQMLMPHLADRDWAKLMAGLAAK